MMLFIQGLDRLTITNVLENGKHDAKIGLHNSSNSFVICGTNSILKCIETEISNLFPESKCKFLNVQAPFHTSQLEVVAKKIKNEIPNLPIVSNIQHWNLFNSKTKVLSTYDGSDLRNVDLLWEKLVTKHF